jgi:hypothetical protein
MDFRSQGQIGVCKKIRKRKDKSIEGGKLPLFTG